MKNYTRREFCGMLGSAAAGSLLLPGLTFAKGDSTPAGNRKNVLFLAVDDLRPQLGCYGNSQVLSPNIDALASQGIVFERAYCQQAICAPSRASVLSGCRPDTTGIYGLHKPLRKAMPDVVSLPQHFRNNGYETISLGKIYHHRSDDLQGWCNKPHFPKGRWSRGYMSADNLKIVEENNQRAIAAGKKPRGIGPAYESFDGPDDGYDDGLNANAAIEQLRRLAGKSAQSGQLDKSAGTVGAIGTIKPVKKPFFLALGMEKPHLPFNAPKKYWDMYDPGKLDLPANPFATVGDNEYTPTSFGELRQYLGIPKTGAIPDDMARKLIHGYCACVSYIDAQIGRVLDELDRLGLSENTAVMLWGDHGWKLGEHGLWSKHTNYELDAHAPLIVRSPGKCPPGTRTKALVEFVDMYPTLCDLCELPQPKHLEGLSTVPLMASPEKAWKSAAFSQYPRHNNVMGYTMRTDRYRYTEWQNRDSGKAVARELYDHVKDSSENFNIATSPANAALIEKLSKQLAAGWRAAKP